MAKQLLKSISRNKSIYYLEMNDGTKYTGNLKKEKNLPTDRMYKNVKSFYKEDMTNLKNNKPVLFKSNALLNNIVSRFNWSLVNL